MERKEETCIQPIVIKVEFEEIKIELFVHLKQVATEEFLSLNKLVQKTYDLFEFFPYDCPESVLKSVEQS